jgi:Arc/MetJ family transcription regulator
MPTNLAIDDALIEEAKRIGHHRTKRDAVTAALLEYIRYRKRLELIEMAGTVDYFEDYDYKALRERRRR